MKKSQKTRKTQKKCRLLIDKISKWKVIFSLFLMISSCKTTKKKETFISFFFYKFFSRLFIQESRKICVHAGILNPFASLTFLFWFIYESKEKGRWRKIVFMLACKRIFGFLCISNRHKKVKKKNVESRFFFEQKFNKGSSKILKNMFSNLKLFR